MNGESGWRRYVDSRANEAILAQPCGLWAAHSAGLRDWVERARPVTVGFHTTPALDSRYKLAADPTNQMAHFKYADRTQDSVCR